MYVPYPRVTQVISEMSPRDWLVRWEKRVGKQNATRIRNETSTVGTIVHYRILKELTKSPIPRPKISMKYCPSNILELCEIAGIQWKQLNQNSIKILPGRCEIERFTLHHKLRVCGTYDIGANIQYHDEPPAWTVADLKTSAIARESHFIQLGAYALFMDPYPDQGMVITLCPYIEKNPLLEPRVYRIDKNELKRYSNIFVDMLERFHDKYPMKRRYTYSK